MSICWIEFENCLFHISYWMYSDFGWMTSDIVSIFVGTTTRWNSYISKRAHEFRKVCMWCFATERSWERTGTFISSRSRKDKVERSNRGSNKNKRYYTLFDDCESVDRGISSALISVHVPGNRCSCTLAKLPNVNEVSFRVFNNNKKSTICFIPFECN